MSATTKNYSYEPAASQEVQPEFPYDPKMEAKIEKDINHLKERDVVCATSQRLPTRMLTRLQRLKLHIRFFKLLVRVLTLALSIFAVYSQAHTLHTFLTTKTIIREGRDPWAKGTQIWPTILLLTTSSLTVIVSMITVIGYFRGVKTANKHASKIGTPMTVVEMAAHLAVWLSTMIAYRVGKTGKDLWGWSCSPKAQKIQDVFPEVSFDFFCKLQGGSWVASIAQVVLIIITGLVWGLTWRRLRQQKKLQTRQSWLLAPNQYAHATAV
jgi:hypothetical protein